MAPDVRVLVVDDEIDTGQLVAHTLKTAGYQVAIVDNGRKALRMIRDLHFDIMLLDVMMPDLDGFDVMREIKSMSGAVPPVVFFTAKGHPTDRELGEGLGAVGYMVKPATRGELLDVIERALGEDLGA
jgi:two-component system copper resistance phosphate regulon response regulator CusR